jgi:hypothetical protein
MKVPAAGQGCPPRARESVRGVELSYPRDGRFQGTRRDDAGNDAVRLVDFRPTLTFSIAILRPTPIHKY